MTNFHGIKVGDVVGLTLKNGHIYKGVICEVGRGSRGSYFPERVVWSKAWNNQKEDNYASYINLDEVKLVVFHNGKNKIQVGSTYLIPTGLKRVVVFADDRGALADEVLTDGSGNKHIAGRKWYNHKITGGWTLVPPEQWVNLYRRSDGVIVAANLKFKSEADALDQQKLDPFTKWIRTVRVDENYNTSSV